MPKKFEKGYAQYVADRDWDTGQSDAKPASRVLHGKAVAATKKAKSITDEYNNELMRKKHKMGN